MEIVQRGLSSGDWLNSVMRRVIFQTFLRRLTRESSISRSSSYTDPAKHHLGESDCFQGTSWPRPSKIFDGNGGEPEISRKTNRGAIDKQINRLRFYVCDPLTQRFVPVASDVRRLHLNAILSDCTNRGIYQGAETSRFSG